MKKNMLEKSCSQKIIQPGIRGTQVAFSDKATFNIDGATDETVVQCDVWVVKNIFVDDSKQMTDTNDK